MGPYYMIKDKARSWIIDFHWGSIVLSKFVIVIVVGRSLIVVATSGIRKADAAASGEQFCLSQMQNWPIKVAERKIPT